MPRVTCDKCHRQVKEKFAVTVEFPDGSTEVICRTCTAGGRK